MNTTFTQQLQQVIEKHNLQDQIKILEDKGILRCNDLFYWGCADSETIENEAELHLLDNCCSEYPEIGTTLFVCRKRQMRPQGAFYEMIDSKYHSVLDECGPYRPAELGNPVASGKQRLIVINDEDGHAHTFNCTAENPFKLCGYFDSVGRLELQPNQELEKNKSQQYYIDLLHDATILDRTGGGRVYITEMQEELNPRDIALPF